MAERCVVLVTSDDWVAKLVAPAFVERRLRVLLANTAAVGLDIAQTTVPSAILCDAALSDETGAWLAERVRQKPNLVGVPFVLVAHVDDVFSRAEALAAGADACLHKPFRTEEVVLGVLALIAMAERCRGAFDAWAPAPSLVRDALEGDLAQLSLSTVLSLLEIERRSGLLSVTGARQAVTVELASGTAVRATLGNSPVAPIAVIRRLLKWKTGRFSFRAGESMEAPDDRRSIAALLMDAAQLEDEAPPSSLESHPPPSFSDDEAETSRGEAPPSRRGGQSRLGPKPPPPLPSRARVEATGRADDRTKGPASDRARPPVARPSMKPTAPPPRPNTTRPPPRPAPVPRPGPKR